MRKILWFSLSLLLLTILVSLANTVKAASTASVSATVTVQNLSVTVNPASVAYGTLPANTSKSTNPASTITATNNGNVTEKISIKGQDTTNWTLKDTVGSDQYAHKFCTSSCGSAPTSYTALSTDYKTLTASVAKDGTQTFDLYITTPNPSTVFTQQDVSVIVLAETP